MTQTKTYNGMSVKQLKEYLEKLPQGLRVSIFCEETGSVVPINNFQRVKRKIIFNNLYSDEWNDWNNIISWDCFYFIVFN